MQLKNNIHCFIFIANCYISETFNCHYNFLDITIGLCLNLVAEPYLECYQPLHILTSLQMMQIYDVIRKDKHQVNRLHGKCLRRFAATLLILPAVRRCSAGRERPSPQPAARWPRCARRPAIPPRVCFPPASRNTA